MKRITVEVVASIVVGLMGTPRRCRLTTARFAATLGSLIAQLHIPVIVITDSGRSGMESARESYRKAVIGITDAQGCNAPLPIPWGCDLPQGFVGAWPKPLLREYHPDPGYAPQWRAMFGRGVPCTPLGRAPSSPRPEAVESTSYDS